MAWVTQQFKLEDLGVNLHSDHVTIKSGDSLIAISPATQDEAHGFALMLRRAARRMEEIGKELE